MAKLMTDTQPEPTVCPALPAWCTPEAFALLSVTARELDAALEAAEHLTRGDETFDAVEKRLKTAEAAFHLACMETGAAGVSLGYRTLIVTNNGGNGDHMGLSDVVAVPRRDVIALEELDAD